MPDTRTAPTEKPDLAKAAQALSDLAKALGQIADALSVQVGEGSPAAEALVRSEKALAEVTEQLSSLQAEETRRGEREEAQRHLRQAILRELLRGPAMPMELAAAVLSLVEEIQPVLAELEREELIEVQRLKGGDIIALTPRGYREAKALA